MRYISFASTLALFTILASSCQMRSCGPHPRRLEFKNLGSADVVKVVGTGGVIVATVIDRAKIADAASFIERHQDGWIDVWSGPRAPELYLEFYQGQRHLDGFGIAENYIVAGSLSRDTPSDEVTALARRLELRWPSVQ